VTPLEETMTTLRASLLTATILAVPAVGLLAEETPPRESARQLDEGLGFSVNKLGLRHTLDLFWRRPLSSSSSPLLKDAHLSIGVTHALTPSYTRLGAWVQFAPLSILEVQAGAEPGAYFGTFGSLMSFSSYHEPFDDGARDARKDEARSGAGSRLYVSPTLRMKLGVLVVASSADFEWWRSSATGPLYYEPARDTLLKVDGDRRVATSTVLLRQHDLASRGTLSYGLIHNLTEVFDASENRSQQIGVVVLRRFGPRRFGLRAPSIGGRVSYYLSDPSRKGQITAAVGMSINLAH
jgi:hypothetical protein